MYAYGRDKTEKNRRTKRREESEMTEKQPKVKKARREGKVAILSMKEHVGTTLFVSLFVISTSRARELAM